MQRLLRAEPRDASVLIIGAGGTAAAIAYWFVRNGLKTLPITIVGREATLFARHDGPFEDRLFTDDVAWGALAPHVREAFLARTTAGVVWDYVLRNLVSENITYESYDALGYRRVGPGPGRPQQLQLEMSEPPVPGRRRRPAPPITTRSASIFIDARGFDRWGFVDDFFAASPLRSFLDAASKRRTPWTIARDLSMRGTLASGAPFPAGLHIPGLGAMQGPSATNLMGLGWLADRVLSRYC
jgi:mycobactin lysine-N-oxygenase